MKAIHPVKCASLQGRAKEIRMISNFTAVVLVLAASIIDIRERRIPDKLVLAGAFVGLLISLIDPQRGFLTGLLGGIRAGAVLILVRYITKGGLGLGDVKLFSCVGIYLRFEDTVSAMFIAAVLSGLYSLALICINKDNNKLELPFAPFILAGVLAAIVF